MEKTPWLFIYFKHRIKVIQHSIDELWITGIGPDCMVHHAVSKTYVDMWDRHFIGLEPGCAWTSIICSPPASLAFRPWTAPEDSVLVIPENLIHRIYDMANRRLIHTANM